MRSPKKNWFWVVSLLLTLMGILAVSKYLMPEHTAKFKGDQLYWDGTIYTICTGIYTEGETIAKTQDGWSINEVEEDASHTFIVIRSFLDQYLMVREDYQIPISGGLSVVAWNGASIADVEFCNAISEILKIATIDYEYETNNIFELTSGQQMHPIYVGYDNCPVATAYIGYLGTVTGRWYITTQAPSISEQSSRQTIYCYTIPQKYLAILEKYLSD